MIIQRYEKTAHFFLECLLQCKVLGSSVGKRGKIFLACLELGFEYGLRSFELITNLVIFLLADRAINDLYEYRLHRKQQYNEKKEDGYFQAAHGT